MTRALIVGVTGFVGPYLAKQLRDQCVECIGLSREPTTLKNSELLNGVYIHNVDVRDRPAIRDLLRTEKPDWVFHLAAISHIPTSFAKPDLAFDVNVGGLFNVLEALRQLDNDPRLLFISSGSVYGQIDSGAGGFSEDSPVHAASPYATSKLVGEQLVRSYAENYGIKAVIARPFNHTGPGQDPSFACPAFALQVAEGMVGRRPVTMRTGLLEPLRDISDVRDVVDAYVRLIQHGRQGEVYNVCSGRMISMNQIISRLAELSGVQVSTELDPTRIRPREVMRSGGDCSRILREIGWSAAIPLDKTLHDLLEYWVRQLTQSQI